MKKLTRSQLQAFVDFFNAIAASWFTAGIITTYFSPGDATVKMLTAVAGLTLTSLCLFFALNVAHYIE